MEKLVEYLKRNIKLAYKTVTFHFKQYFCFYVALLIIETLCSMIMMSGHNNAKMLEKQVRTEYTYHFTITGVDFNKRDYFTDEDGTYAGERLGVNHALGNIEVVERETGGKKVYDLKCTLECDSSEKIKDLKQLYTRFQRVYAEGLRHTNIEFSPLYSLKSDTAQIKGNAFVWTLLLEAVSFAVLVLLYNIRINHFKFTYGIYMSFGADYKRLFSTCFWELFVIAFLTLIPSTVVAVIADCLFYKVAGYSYYFSPQFGLYSLLFAVVAVMLSVAVTVKTMAIKPPLKLLLAEDNSNLVVSPRLSFQMFGTKFPSSYEKFGLWRFRKYNISLVFSAVLFSALFVLTSYYGTVYKYTVETEKEEYTINFPQHAVQYQVDEEVLKDVHDEYYQLYIKVEIDKDATDAEKERFEEFEADRQNFIDGIPAVKFVFGDYNTKNEDYKTIKEKTIETVTKTRMEGDTYTEEKRDELMKISGITSLYKYCTTKAMDIDSHVIFDSANTKLSSGFLVHPKEETSTVTNEVGYFAADKEVVDYVKKYYNYVGDPDDIISKDKQIILSDSLDNSKVLKIKPGDTVRIAKMIEIPTYNGSKDDLVGDWLLNYMLESGTFEYETYTVCAVIKDIPTESGLPIFLSSSEYENIVGKAPIYNGVSVYIDQSLEREAVDEITSEIRSWAEEYSDTNVVIHNALTESKAERAMRKLPLFNTIAIMLLIISPLFWFFSQIMFYKKREKEFELLRGMGAIESEIKKIFIYDGIVMACLGVLVLCLLSGVGIYAIYTFTLKLMPYISKGMKLKFVFSMPWVPAVISVIVTAACGFTSSFIPYISEKKTAEKRISEEFGE